MCMIWQADSSEKEEETAIANLPDAKIRKKL